MIGKFRHQVLSNFPSLVPLRKAMYGGVREKYGVLTAAQTTIPQGTSLMLLSGICSTTLSSLTCVTFSDQSRLFTYSPAYLFDHRFGHDLNLALFESGLGVLDELFAEHWKYRGESLDEGDPDSARKFGIPGFQVILDREMCKRCCYEGITKRSTSRKSCNSPL
jgi:hypothetical protein